MESPFDLAGKTILVTGAATGLGRATAVLLGRLGAKIVLVSRNAERLQSVAETLAGTGHLVHPFDLNDIHSIPAWMKQVAQTAGPLWGVVHSAATLSLQPLQFLKLSSVEEIARVNVAAAFALAKGFRQRGVCGDAGSIVLISSVSALRGDPGNSAYAASKGALLAMTQSLAVELAPQKIRINCIAPAFIETEMTRQSLAATLTPAQFDVMKNRSPLGPGNPEDVAAAAAFLLAESARWITGTTLVIDGGYLAK